MLGKGGQNWSFMVIYKYWHTFPMSSLTEMYLYIQQTGGILNSLSIVTIIAAILLFYYYALIKFLLLELKNHENPDQLYITDH